MINRFRPAISIWHTKKYIVFMKSPFNLNEYMKFYCIRLLQKSILHDFIFFIHSAFYTFFLYSKIDFLKT